MHNKDRCDLWLSFLEYWILHKKSLWCTQEKLSTHFFLRTAHIKKTVDTFFFKCVDNFFLNLVTENWKVLIKNWKVLTKNWKVLTKTIIFAATARHIISLLNNLLVSFLNLFISLTELKNIHWKLPLKKHRCKFKIDKTTCSKSQSRSASDDSKNKPSFTL